MSSDEDNNLVLKNLKCKAIVTYCQPEVDQSLIEKF